MYVHVLSYVGSARVVTAYHYILPHTILVTPLHTVFCTSTYERSLFKCSILGAALIRINAERGAGVYTRSARTYTQVYDVP